MNPIQAGNAPCSWGTLNIEGIEVGRIGYRQMLDELAETGYTGTELGDWGFMPTGPSVLRAALAKRRLAMLGAYVPVALQYPQAHADGEAHALRVARLLAAVSDASAAGIKPFIVLADNNGTDPVRTKNAGRITPEMGLSDAQWQTFTRGAERIARAVRNETDLPTAFHHHCGGFVETPAETARFLDMTDPSLIGLVFDTGHYAYGTGRDDCRDVQDGLVRFGDRIWHMHFKDFEPDIAARARAEAWNLIEAVQHGIFCELGKGCVNFSGIVTWLQDRGYRGWLVVEQDVLPGMGEPRQSARRNRAYLKSIGI